MPPVKQWVCFFDVVYSIKALPYLLHRAYQTYQVLYGLVVLFAITRASVFVAGSFLALVVVEASASVCESPVISLVDSAVRNSFGVGG